MVKKTNRNEARKKRHRSIRARVSGTPERPRLNVYKSNKHIYAQITDDFNGHTLVSASTLDPELKGKLDGVTKTEAAKMVGELAAKRAVEKNITKVIFDRSGYIYHGRIKEVAEGARQAGLQF